jgi:hypothetical protein
MGEFIKLFPAGPPEDAATGMLVVSEQCRIAMAGDFSDNIGGTVVLYRPAVLCAALVSCCLPRLQSGRCCLERTLLSLMQCSVVRMVPFLLAKTRCNPSDLVLF